MGAKLSAEQLDDIADKAQNILSKEDIKRHHHLFAKYAKDGALDKENFIKFARKVGFAANWDAETLYDVMDMNHDNRVDFPELIMFIAHAAALRRGASVEAFADLCFALYDANEDGFISKEEMYEALKIRQKIVTGRAEVDDAFVNSFDKIFASIDTNADGKLTKDELRAALNKSKHLWTFLVTAGKTKKEVRA